MAVGECKWTVSSHGNSDVAGRVERVPHLVLFGVLVRLGDIAWIECGRHGRVDLSAR